MTPNQKRKTAALILMVVAIVAMVATVLLRVLCGIRLGTLPTTLMLIAVAICIIVYRNYNVAVKDDQKYGPHK